MDVFSICAVSLASLSGFSICKPETRPSTVEVLFLLAAFPISSNNWVMTSGNGATGFYLKLNFFRNKDWSFIQSCSCGVGVQSSPPQPSSVHLMLCT